jgi:uncharacterized membrane protein (UPF0136 family)
MFIYYEFIFAVLTVVGGIIGYLTKGSQASLISGTVTGLLLAYNSYALMQQKAYGYYGLLALSVVVLGLFIMRYFKTHQFMPAGLMIGLSLVSIVGLLLYKNQLLPTMYS